MKILIVEDEPELATRIHSRLTEDGYRCESATLYKQAREKIYVYDYDLLILDINLPDGTGLDLIRLAKQEKSTTPIIVISARNSLNQKIEGLELGADDYLTKPFELAELTARVKSVLRRWSFDGSNQITAGNITVDPDSKTVTVDGADLNLTRTEYSLLLYFMANPNRVLSRDSIAEHIWGDHMDMADTFDFLYTHMKNLRKKIKDAGGTDPIKAVYGVGYKLVKL